MSDKNEVDLDVIKFRVLILNNRDYNEEPYWTTKDARESGEILAYYKGQGYSVLDIETEPNNIEDYIS